MKEEGYFLNAGVLFNVATSAYERTKSAPSDKTVGQKDSWVAILFSAASLEAFVTELAYLARSYSSIFGHEVLQSVASILEEAEGYRGSIRLKFLVAKMVLGGVAYDRGVLPYQDFDMLFRIRDAIAHLKPEKITEESGKFLKYLRGRNLVEDPEPDVTSSWLADISTRSVALWACNVVVDMVDSVKVCLPSESEEAVLISSHLSRIYRRVR